MPNASPTDAKAGFEIYRQSGGVTSLENLNRRLVETDHGPVSQRTFRHYRRLVDTGISDYIPINRFDVARASGDLD